MIDDAAPLLLTVLVLAQVGVWQCRVSLATRGRRRAAALLAGVDAVVYVTVLGRVLRDLDQPVNVAAYAVGVSLGVYLGCVADARANREPLEYRLVAPESHEGLLAALRQHGWPVTATVGDGLGGGVTVLFVAVAAPHAARLEDDLRTLAPGVFWTSSRLRSASPVPLPDGFLRLDDRSPRSDVRHRPRARHFPHRLRRSDDALLRARPALGQRRERCRHDAEQ